MAKTSDLKVCGRCGWYAHDRPGKDDKDCNPVGGAAADALVAAVGLPATKLGYGESRLTIYLDGATSTDGPDGYIPPHITLQVSQAGRFHIESVWCVDNFGAESMAQLVLALRGSPLGLDEKSRKRLP